MDSAHEWAIEEFGNANLGDVRRTRRLVALAAQAASQPAGTVTKVCHTSASREGAFRLLENGAVRARVIQDCVKSAAVRRCRSKGTVFVAVDATSLNITDNKRAKGLGAVGSWEAGARGIHAMTALAVARDGVPLGIAAQKLWVRHSRSRRISRGSPETGGEILHWLSVIEECRANFEDGAPEATPWFQLDRGADCWQVLDYAGQHDVLVTVRATHDRRLDGELGRLWSTLEKAKTRAEILVDLPARGPRERKKRIGNKRIKQRIGGRKAHRATMTVRAVTVPLKLTTPFGTKTVTMNAVLVREKRAHAKNRVEWLLLSTHPIRTRAEVLDVVRGYGLRWRVEDFHRAWKSGICRVEETQLRARESLYKWTTLLASVATRAMRLTHQARQTPDVPATTELSELELEALVALRDPKEPKDHPTLAEAVRWLADIGGYVGPRNGPPGAIVIGRGLESLAVAVQVLQFQRTKR